MRQIKRGAALAVRAIGGLHVVTLAWDFVPGAEHRRQGLLGFAIERSELAGRRVTERYFLRGMKRFQHKDEGLPPGTPVPTSEHPVQSFQWGDYTAKPGHTYRYRVVPVYGEPKRLTLDNAASTTVRITTEAEQGPQVRAGKQGGARHDIFFNRGVAASQAYALKFVQGNPQAARPDETQPHSAQMAWLSRGLFEALTAFIGRASGPEYALRAMLYEFRYLPVGQAFGQAVQAGADVDIRYEAQAYRDLNEEMIAQAGLQAVCKPQKSRAGIRHNKFIVLLHRGKPVAVWTGSTNISAGGIFGHSNVGHAVWDATLAGRYLAYWQRLAAPDVTRAPLVQANLRAEPTPAPGSAPPEGRILTLFSPRDDPQTLDTLHWYAQVMASARRVVCMTFAFGLDDLFRDVLLGPGDTLRYALFDKPLKGELTDQIELVQNTVIASGTKLASGDMENFIGEALTGFNHNEYIHDKFMLVDPLGDDPVVITGSANFSRPSQHANDENMLVIRGNPRVADIYFGEFMRIFDHLYARYVIATLKRQHRSQPGAGYLQDTDAWVAAHFRPGRKEKRRRYFMGE